MRILHWYPNFLGGGATTNAALGLANAQTRLGAQIAIAAANSLSAPLYGSVCENIATEVKLITWKPSWVLKQGSFVFRGLPSEDGRTLSKWKPDLVHIHGEFNADNLRVPDLFQCPLVLSPHGAFAPQVFAKNRQSLKKLYVFFAKRLLYRRVKAFHALSPMEDAHINQLLPGARTYRVPEGPNFRAEQKVDSRKHSPHRDRVSFLFVGRLDVFTKGLDLLLEAFAEAHNSLREPAISLTLVGPDWQGGVQYLRRRARQLGVTEQVAFTGSLSPEDVSATLCGSDIYIQLSRHDVFSLSVAEALLARKPAILSENIGILSWPEVASLPYIRIVSARVNDAVDAMVKFAVRLGPLKMQAEQCQPKLMEFLSWERVARVHLNAYRDLTQC
jgi:glycosyltransferase involved in cell wall biosynthesis